MINMKMDRRDFVKTSSALALAPLLPNIGKPIKQDMVPVGDDSDEHYAVQVWKNRTFKCFYDETWPSGDRKITFEPKWPGIRMRKKALDLYNINISMKSTFGGNFAKWPNGMCLPSAYFMWDILVFYPLKYADKMADLRIKLGFEVERPLYVHYYIWPTTVWLDKDHEILLNTTNKKWHRWRKVYNLSTLDLGDIVHLDGEYPGLKHRSYLKPVLPGPMPLGFSPPKSLVPCTNNVGRMTNPNCNPLRRIIVRRNPNTDAIGAGKIGYLI